jgi:two-component system, OmpR family, response regulator
MQKKKILIIDDDVSLTQMVRINLEETGDYDVLVQNRSSRAIDSARSFRPDLILLDYIMPGMDGGDVSALIHADPFLKNVPIIMVTALVSNAEADEEGFVRRGGHLMIAKPIKFSVLDQAIRSCLAQAA